MRKELSAVSECSKRVVSSTFSFGKKFKMRRTLTKCQLFISKPNTRIISNEGSASILPPSYKIISSANTRKNFTFNVVFVIIMKSKNFGVSLRYHWHKMEQGQARVLASTFAYAHQKLIQKELKFVRLLRPNRHKFLCFGFRRLVPDLSGPLLWLD